MDFLRSLVLAFSSFSSIPMPQMEWREGNMRFLMCCFPFVGVAIGAALALWFYISDILGFGPVLFGAGIALVPIAVSGGIHLDGFCDVVDAQSSHAQPERKREILKDSHAGAFAAIGIAVYLVAYIAFSSELPNSLQIVLLLGGMHVISRCMSAVATLGFPTSASKGMLAMFHESGEGKTALVIAVIEFLVCAGAMVYINPIPACAMIVVGLACLVFLYPFAKTQFGGMSGDLAGFFLQVAELCMVVALVVALKVMVL